MYDCVHIIYIMCESIRTLQCIIVRTVLHNYEKFVTCAHTQITHTHSFLSSVPFSFSSSAMSSSSSSSLSCSLSSTFLPLRDQVKCETHQSSLGRCPVTHAYWLDFSTQTLDISTPCTHTGTSALYYKYHTLSIHRVAHVLIYYIAYIM